MMKYMLVIMAVLSGCAGYNNPKSSDVSSVWYGSVALDFEAVNLSSGTLRISDTNNST